MNKLIIKNIDYIDNLDIEFEDNLLLYGDDDIKDTVIKILLILNDIENTDDDELYNWFTFKLEQYGIRINSNLYVEYKNKYKHIIINGENSSMSIEKDYLSYYLAKEKNLCLKVKNNIFRIMDSGLKISKSLCRTLTEFEYYCSKMSKKDIHIEHLDTTISVSNNIWFMTDGNNETVKIDEDDDNVCSLLATYLVLNLIETIKDDSILMIDEIENGIDFESLQYVIDDILNTGTQFMMTTSQIDVIRYLSKKENVKVIEL